MLRAATVSSRHSRAAEAFMLEGGDASFSEGVAGVGAGLSLSAPPIALAAF